MHQVRMFIVLFIIFTSNTTHVVLKLTSALIRSHDRCMLSVSLHPFIFEMSHVSFEGLIL